MNKFPWTIGIEMTGISEDYTNVDDHFVSWAKVIDKYLKLKEVSYDQCINDIHCVEVTSKVLNSKEEYRIFSQSVREAFERYHIKPKHPTVVDGGNHIHVGVTNPSLAAFIYRDITNHPFLPWVFSEPDEIESCDNLIKETTRIKKWSKVLAQEKPKELIDIASIYIGKDEYSVHQSLVMHSPLSMNLVSDRNFNYFDSKSQLISRNPHYQTVEFRFFEAPYDWSEQEDQIDFLLAYMHWVCYRYQHDEKVTPNILTRKQLQKIKQSTAINAFKLLLKNIGLEYSRYEKYVQRNLKPRWENGRDRR
jgi:hypothetical protein